RLFGVIIPSNPSSGVREAPDPVVPGWDRINVRVTLLSYLAGVPYSRNPSPGSCVHGSKLVCSAAPADLMAIAPTPAALSVAIARFKKIRRSSKPLPALGSIVNPILLRRFVFAITAFPFVLHKPKKSRSTHGPRLVPSVTIL